MSIGQGTWAGAMAVLAAAGTAGAWELPLDVAEYWGQGPLRREYWQQEPGVRHVSGGVPLLAGQTKEPAELRLMRRDLNGTVTPVPAQFKVLARWWRQDHSIRWVLVDFVISAQPVVGRTYVLTTGADPAAVPPQPVRVEETENAITVTTGPARFVIDRKRFALLTHALVDADGDGAFAPDDDLLATSPDHGTVLEDTYGLKYYASEGTKSVAVIEQGPLRVCVRARGEHRARKGEGYSRGLYGYDVFLHFYAGSADVFIDPVITNNPPKSIGSPTFEDASLLIKLRGGANAYRLYGAGPLDGKLAEGESVCLYQDSNGAEQWERCPGYLTSAKTVSFRGYRVLRRKGGAEEVVGNGDRARGLVHLMNDAGGVIVHTRNFWQQFPKAVEVGADGTVRVGLFPRESVVPHYLEDASAKGHEIVLSFYAAKAKPRYPTDGAGRPWPHYIADLWDDPVQPRPPLTHIAATGALADLGPYSVPTAGFYDYPLEVMERKLLMAERYWGHGYGWQVFGSRWYAHGGHSSRGARQPIRDDADLYRGYVTGLRGWRLLGQANSRQFRDVRCYRIEEQDPFGFKNWQAFRKANRSEDYCNRPQPTDDEYKKYSQGLWERSTWWLPNPAHMVLDLCYDRYLLFGDVRSFENLKIIAGHGGNYVAYNKPFVHRETGWCWRTLERYWELTGDQDAEACLKDTIKTYEPLIGKVPLVCGGETSSADGVNWWFTQVFSRAVAMTALHMGDPKALELLKTLGQSVPEKQARYFCTLFAVLYHLTGDEQHKRWALGQDDGQGLLTVVAEGDFPATAHWLLHQPPKTATLK
jgi:hypothetical protein